jgi:phosphohistidine swiveling domain-containing protein
MSDLHRKIEWFWAHRRNSSLHHFSLLMTGLAGRGWLPVVNFWFDNQIVIGVPNKGCYIFYDRQQLSSGVKYKDIQESIDKNPNFVEDFKRRSDEIFGALFFACQKINEDNLSLLSLTELASLYREFITALMAAPLITVQLWGIEACFDENYKIISFLKEKLKELDKENLFETYKEIISANTGETVAFTEQKNFYQVASELYKNEELRALFREKDCSRIAEELSKYAYENALFEKHIIKYEWVNTEYVSGGWPKEKWIELFQKALNAEQSPEQKLRQLLENFSSLNEKRSAILEELNPPAEVAHAINALAELIAQRDWAKGNFTKALLSYNKLLDEIARRLGITRNDILSYSYQEIQNYFDAQKTVLAEEIRDRQNYGFAIVIKGGKFELISGKDNIENCIRQEGIAQPFETLTRPTEFKGLPACRGLIRGRARVLEDASKISEFKEGEILITYMTTIEFIPVFRKASAVVTDEGGMSCHAAIISREFKLPCIVGTQVATRVIKTGDEIEVDAIKGVVKILNQE